MPRATHIDPARSRSPETTLRLAMADASALPRVAPRGRAPGVQLVGGDYRLDRLVAVGGMGSVWAATHVTLGRRVAVKFVDALLPSPEVVRRFLREAQLAAAVRHPHVVDVIDFGLTDDGEPVMVMELLEGETLQAIAPRLDTDRAVRVIAQILSALDAVHRAGILHLDIKPANIVVVEEPDMFARLLDFGIARSLGGIAASARYVSGTPQYMSPEQAEGQLELDERTDVYAASVILYELLSAGASPFADVSPRRALARVMLGGQPSLASLRPDLGELARVVDHGMAYEREDRPESASALRRALLAARCSRR